MASEDAGKSVDELTRAFVEGSISRKAFLRRAGALGIALPSVASILAACGGDEAATEGGGGAEEVVVGWPATPSRLNQQFDFGGAANEANLNAGEQSARWLLETVDDPAGALDIPFHQVSASFEDIMEARLLEDWSISPDWRVFTFRFKPDIASHAGNELTAEMVRWNWAEWDFESKGVGLFFAQVGSVSDPSNIKVIDSHTVEVTVDRTNPLYLMNLCQVNRAIYDATLMKENATDEDPFGNQYADTNDAGFGAYVVTDFTADRQWVFERFEDYSFQKPTIRRIVNRAIPDGAQRLALLKRGEIDVARGLIPRELQSVQEDTALKVWNLQGVNQLQFFLNPTVKPLDKKEVRQALSYAVPYDAIVENVLLGFGRRSRSPVPDLFPGSIPAWEYDYDPERARSLLSSAGEDGFTLQITYASDDPLAEPVLTIMRTEFEGIGVNVELQALPRGAYTESLLGKKNMAALEQNAPYTPDPYFLLSWYTTESGLNYYNHNDPQYDKMVDDGLSIVDWPRRLAYFENVQEYLAENGHVIPIAFTGFNVATRAEVSGVNDYLETMAWGPVRV